MRTKLIFIFAMVMLMGNVYSQDEVLTSKRGTPILPQEGEFAIGMNGVTVLQYFGNMFNGTMNNQIWFNFIDNTNAIFGKYFFEDLKAYRFSVRVGQTINNDVRYILDDDDPTFKYQVTDRHTRSATNIILGAGIEHRKGVNRIQGFYGVDALLMIQSGSDKYKYGNEITGTNTNPTTHNFGTNLLPGGERVLSEKDGLGFGLGARIFVGLEYFVFPKLSIGGEFGWGLMAGLRGASSVKTEYWDAVDITVKEDDLKGNKGSFINLDTDNAGGTIKILFHF